MSEALVLGLVFAVLLLAGVPIAFAIGLSAVGALLVTLDPAPAATVLAQRMATGIDSFALLAIPFFILAGNLMNRGGIATRLIALAKVLVGRLPGGLACINVLANMLFGAISGSAAAAAAANGGVMTPLMTKEGYNREYAAAVNISSATTGLLIPPSNIMVVYSMASGGVSIAALFLAGYIPGLLLGLALMLVAALIAKRHGYPTAGKVGWGEAVRILWDAVPSLMLIALIMGGIIFGWFTPTEASAIAVVYTFVLSVLVYRQVKWSELPRLLADSAETTAMVLVLVGASMGMSWVMASANIPQVVSAGLLELTQDKTLLLLIITIILLVVGTFMDMTPAVLIFTPIFLPVVKQFGMDPIHFGLVMIFNLCIGLCTPPVGSVLFIGCGVAQTTIAKVVRPLLPFFAAMLVVLLAVTYVPALSLWLPKVLGF
ncbi:MAG TPA: TRAP transporter large permease [Opitutaceae bacterium]|jgi:tripartite ATP-independent transporter DctM subunit|nr:TRAP transporter large permease [Opitutaceae bacterium]HRE07794.1 TRAP transporter large permease [Opitutaceae bacterium]